MDYLKPYDFKQLKAFFLALQQSRFNLRQISTVVIMDGVTTPVDKAHCLQLLRSFPNLSGEEFKDDNFLIKYLSQPGNIKQILGRLTTTQQIELTKVLEEKPAAAGVTGEQPGGQEISTGQTMGEPAGTMVGASPQTPNFPSAPYARSVSTPKIIRQTSTASEETKSLTNTDQTAAVKEAKRIVPTKTPVPEAFQQAFKNQPEHTLNPILKPSIPTPIVNSAKTFGSNTQIFARKNLGRIGRGLGEIAKGVGRGIAAPGLNGAYTLLGKAGGHGLSAFERLSNPGLRGASRSFASSGSKKIVWGLLGAFLILVVGTGFIGGTTGTTPSGEAAPISTSSILDYTIPFRDSSVTVADPDGVKKQVLARWPDAKLENWDIIVSESIKNSWNPAFVLTLWIEETGAQGEPSYSDPLGCAPVQPTTDINLSLSCLFNNFQNYTNDQFDRFMLRYSEGFSGTTFATNPSFPSQIKDWYSKLVPSGVGALSLISTQTAEALGCPTVGTITNPYGYNIPGQPNDIDYYGCSSLSSCHSGIDIAYGRGTSVSATFDALVVTVSSDDIKGKYVTISNSQTGYSATFAHLDSQIVSVGASVKRGQVIGTMGATGAAGGVHLHYRLERNSKVINPFRYLGSSGLIATISLISSDEIGENNYQGKPESFNWGQCNQVP